jgi:uncharacterized small protein (DUF1192 family)
MFDEDLPKQKTGEFPRNLETMSVSDLQDYISDLENEITRVKGDMSKKKASQDAAASVFKI